MAYKLLDSLGYYRIKKNIKHRLFCRKIKKEDAQRKLEVQEAINAMHGKQLSSHGDASDVIVSLTSYGERVSDTLPYALFSLIHQIRQPNRIVVWLDHDNWSDEKLPDILKKLQELGVEFYYVKDLRPYKKLIPALKVFPDNVIITVDDDWYYNDHTVEWLMNDYQQSDRRTVFGTWGYCSSSTEDMYDPYNTWRKNGVDPCNDISLIGCGGILYPPHIFDEEIFNEDVFMSLAPTADDLWFWAMEKRCGIPVRFCSVHGYGLHTAVNRITIYEPTVKGSLYLINEINGKNDEQLFKLISHYHLKPNQ